MRLIGRTVIVLIAMLTCFGMEETRAYDRQLPDIAHYSSEYSRVGFILDFTGDRPKLKFDGSDEILVLNSIPAAGGDKLLERDDHFVVLRISFLGGVTLFTPDNMRGVPVAPDRRPVQALVSSVPPINVVRDYAARITAQARAETGREIFLDANWAQAARDTAIRELLFDSIRNAGTALIDWIRSGAGRSAIGTRLKRIQFVAGPPTLPYRQGDTLVIVFTPGQGKAGRPASSVIYQQLAQFAR